MIDKYPAGQEEKLNWWDTCAETYDTYGLPIDIMWCWLRDNRGLTMDSELFKKSILDMVKMRNVGGWEVVLKELKGK